MRGDLTNLLIAGVREGINTAPRIAAKHDLDMYAVSCRLGELARSGVLVRIGAERVRGRKPSTIYAVVDSPSRENPPTFSSSPLAWAALRPSPHTTLTAMLLGDPSPGRSALDQRQRSA